MFSFITQYLAIPFIQIKPVHNPSSFSIFDKESNHIKQNVIFESLLKIFRVKTRNKIHSSHHFIPLPTFADELGFDWSRLGLAQHRSKLLIRASLDLCISHFLWPNKKDKEGSSCIDGRNKGKASKNMGCLLKPCFRIGTLSLLPVFHWTKSFSQTQHQWAREIYYL